MVYTTKFVLPSQSSSNGAPSKTVLVIYAEGVEIMDAVTLVDMLRLAEVNVVTGSIHGTEPVKCARGMRLIPMLSFNAAIALDVEYDAVIIPGGPKSTELLAKDEKVGEVLKEQNKSGRIVAAIKDGFQVLTAHGVGLQLLPLEEEEAADDDEDYLYSAGATVVVNDNIITTKGTGSARWFSLKLIEKFMGKQKADSTDIWYGNMMPRE